MVRIFRYINRNINVVISAIFIAAVFLCIGVFWPEGYMAGGDDGGLYYLIPEQMILNFVFNVIGHNMPGGLGQYFPQLYQAPLLLLVYITKLATFDLINVQKLLFGLNLTVGFISFIKLKSELNIFFGGGNVRTTISTLLGGIIYTTSSALVFSLWYHLLFVIYLQAVFPLVLMLWFRSINKGTLIPLILANIIISMFMVTIVPFPYLLGSIIIISPLLLYAAFKRPKRVILYSIFLIGLILLTNAYIFIHLLIKVKLDVAQPSSVIDSITSAEVIKAKEPSILYNAKAQSTIYSISNEPHKGYFDLSSFYQATKAYYSFNFILIGIVLASAYVGSMRKNTYNLFITICFILAVRLFTISTPPYGTETFLWLSYHIPFFVALRTSMDKFSVGYSLIFALLLTLSSENISNKIRFRLLRLAFLMLLSIILCLNAVPLLSGLQHKEVRYGMDNYKLFNHFDRDFDAMIKYIKTLPDDDANFLWTPLNTGGYAILPDRDSEHYYYVGISPLLYLTGKNDFAGYLGFPIGTNDKIFSAIDKADWNMVGEILKTLNTRYVIVNNAISQSMVDVWVLGKSLVQKQKGITQILGKKLASFGNRYEIYALDNKYLSSKVRLSPPSSGTIDFKRQDTNTYLIHISDLSQKSQVIFTEINSDLWVLTPQSQNRSILSRDDLFIQERSPEYQNIWSIDPAKIKKLCSETWCSINKDGSYNLKLQLFFAPDLLVWPSIYISLMLHFILIFVLLINWVLGVRSRYARLI